MNWSGIFNKLPGVLLAIVLGFAVWFASSSSRWTDPMIMGILCGMLLRTILGNRAALNPGLEWAPSLLIPPGIILYGANLRLGIDIVSPLTWLQIFIGIIVVVWLAGTFGRWLGLSGPAYLLLAVGTAICGASAIIIAKPVVEAENKDTATALLVVTIWGLAGLFLLPYIANLLGMDIESQARFYATTLHQTGIVKMAALEAGDKCLAIASTIKVARTVTIIPLLLIVGSLYRLPSLDEVSSYNKISFKIRIPWYLWGFIASGLLFTFATFLTPYAPAIKVTSSIAWTMAMSAVGLTVDLKEVFRSLARPLLLGLIIWLGLLAIFFYGYFNRTF